MKNLAKYLWLAVSGIALISCQGGNNTSNNPPTTNLSPLAQYKSLLVYNSAKSPNKTLDVATQNNQQSFTVSNNAITLTNIKINFYRNNNCSQNSLITTIDLSGGDGVAFQPGTYTSSGAANLALCGRYPGGCTALYDSFSADNTTAMSFEYTYVGGKVYSAGCMAGSSDSNNKEAVINWSANGGVSEWGACTDTNCGFSQPYNITLPESSSLTSYFMLVGAGGMITDYKPYSGLLNNVLYPTTIGIKSVAFTPTNHIVAVGYNGIILTADDISGTHMKSVNSNTINNLNSIAISGSGTYVAVGDNGVILRSTDEVNWQPAQTIPTANNLNGVASNQTDSFVTVGANGTILYSNDGESWNLATGIDPDITLYGVAENSSGVYVAVGYNATSGDSIILYSNDGSTWNTATGSFNGSILYAVAITPAGEFVAVSEQGNVYYSTDNGSQWSAYPIIRPVGSPAPALYGVSVESNGTIVVVGQDNDLGNGVIYTANNPTTSSSWQQVASTNQVQLNGVTTAGTNKYIAVGGYNNENQIIMNSTDGQSWNTIQPLTSSNLQGIACTNTGVFSAVGSGGTTLTSNNGTSWSVNTNPTFSNDAYSVMATNTGLFFLGGQGLIESSATGTIWSNSYSNETITIRDITQDNNGSIIAVGSQKTILSSANYGLSWSALIPTVSGNELYGVAANNSGIIVVVGMSGGSAKIYSSADNDNFATNRINPGIANMLYGVAVNSSGRFVAIGNTQAGGSVIVYSDDGVSWTVANLSSSLSTPLYAVAVNSSGLFVAVGDSGLVMTSIDGATWNQQTPLVNGVILNGITAY